MAPRRLPTSGSAGLGPQPSRGFTFIELMVVIAIVAIMAAMAGPAYDWLFRSQRVKNAATELQMALMLARSEAIKRNGSVSLQPVNGDGTWAGGWSVKSGAVDVQKTGAFTNVSFSGVTGNITFGPVGRPNVAASVTVSDTGSTSERRCVSISSTGRVNVKTGAC